MSSFLDALRRVAEGPLANRGTSLHAGVLAYTHSVLRWASALVVCTVCLSYASVVMALMLVMALMKGLLICHISMGSCAGPACDLLVCSCAHSTLPVIMQML